MISTASLFPDFLAGGAVDLYLSKPISRLRLFLFKYSCGLLFVALQIGCFCLASFLVIGLRGMPGNRDCFLPFQSSCSFTATCFVFAFWWAY